MAKANRVLTEGEIDEQLRLGIKKELLAYINDAVPYSQKIDVLIEAWKQVNTNLQLICAERKRQMRFLEMMPKTEREIWVTKLCQVMLPSA